MSLRLYLEYHPVCVFLHLGAVSLYGGDFEPGMKASSSELKVFGIIIGFYVYRPIILILFILSQLEVRDFHLPDVLGF